MTNKTKSKKEFQFEHYTKTPVDLKPFSGKYEKRLFKDQHTNNKSKSYYEHSSDLIYGKL